FDGTLDISGAVSGSGFVLIGHNATLKLDGSVADTQTVSFAPTSTLELTAPDSFAGHLSGFDLGDVLDLAGFDADSTTVTYCVPDGMLVVTDANHTEKFTLDGDYSNASFIPMSDGHDGVDITIPFKIAGDLALTVGQGESVVLTTVDLRVVDPDNTAG